MPFQYEMKASFIEIYNETLRDLLTTTRKDKTVKHEIRIDSKHQGEVYVTNIAPITINSQLQVNTVGSCVYHSVVGRRYIGMPRVAPPTQ